MAPRPDVRTVLGELVEEIVATPAEAVTPDATFVDDLSVDSLSMLELVIGVEQRLGVRMRDDDVLHLRQVSDAVRLIDAELDRARD